MEYSQKISTEIREKVAASKITGAKINQASELYRPAANRGALIFFVMKELHRINSLYQYSLESFIDVIVRTLLVIKHEYEEIDKN